MLKPMSLPCDYNHPALVVNRSLRNYFQLSGAIYWKYVVMAKLKVPLLRKTWVIVPTPLVPVCIKMIQSVVGRIMTRN